MLEPVLLVIMSIPLAIGLIYLLSQISIYLFGRTYLNERMERWSLNTATTILSYFRLL